MLRSTRSRKQPDSIFRLQEEDHRLRKLRVVETGSTLDTDNNGDDSQKCDTSHELRPCKVAKISEDTLSKKGTSSISKRKPKTPERSTDNDAETNGDALHAKRTWQGQGHTKLGFLAKRFAKILLVGWCQ